MDRGMTSHENRRILQRAGGQHILDEKLRSNKLNMEALGKGGRFKVLRDNLHIKEVTIGKGVGHRRFVIVYNPDETKYDQETRTRILARIRSDVQRTYMSGRIPVELVADLPCDTQK